MIESTKTLIAGISGILVTWMEWLPVAIRVLVGLATFIYIIVKIVREIKLMKEKNNGTKKSYR
tara:strand:- start:593 stop:781 length:189 start_codon:yes stop_codon:yes gene_type:complete